MPPAREIAALDAASLHGCPLVRKLGNYTRLSTEEVDALSAVPHHLRDYPAHSGIAVSGERPTSVAVVVEGVAARVKHLEDGRRQILSFHVQGDVLDLHNLLLAVSDHDLEAISRCRVGFLPRAALQAVMKAHPGIGRALLFDAFVDAAITREWLANIGRRSAYERMAHLMCELAHRLYLIGQARDGQFGLPVTQADLSDALGITAVHANRTLQLLRSDKLIATKGKAVAVLDWDGLVAAAGFDPAYLHMEGLDSVDDWPDEPMAARAGAGRP